MKYLVLALSIAVINTGCAIADTRGMQYQSQWCDQGELNRCVQLARSQIYTKTRSPAEANVEFLQTCARVSTRHNLKADCATLSKEI